MPTKTDYSHKALRLLREAKLALERQYKTFGPNRPEDEEAEATWDELKALTDDVSDALMHLKPTSAAMQRHYALERHRRQTLPTIKACLKEHDNPSIRTIAQYLNDRNTPAPSGRRWHPETTRRVLKMLEDAGDL